MESSQVRNHISVLLQRASLHLEIIFCHAVGLFFTDQPSFFVVAELGRNAMSVQAAPHDPGAGLQYVLYI